MPVEIYDTHEIQTAIKELNNLRDEVLFEDKHADPWEALSTQELEWIEGEITRCCADFRYAAANYFWLGQTKEAESTLLKLWPTQELFLSVVLNMWADGEPAWIIIHKGRQVGISTVVEALMAWKNLFFTNQISMIIAQDPDQAEHLLKISLYIMDHMPWWMRPMEQSREFKEAMILENSDPFERSFRPGSNNWIIANGCTKVSAFGQGKPIHCCHLSELSSWPSDRARKIVSQDMKYAFARRPGCFAIMESKPRGLTGWWYNQWHVFDAQGLKAKFFPFFVPSLFEASRAETPPAGWEPDEPTVMLREEFSLAWDECQECGTPLPKRWGQVEECLRCHSKNIKPMMLSDAQLYWYREEEAAARLEGSQELKDFHQELCITPEQGFQTSAMLVFPDEVMAWLQETCKPGEKGYFDDAFNWHAERNCKICKLGNGVGDDHLEENWPSMMWELPQDGAKYVAGVDVAEGEEEGDYSVIHVIKIGYGFGIPDKQVFEWYGHIDGHEFARVCYLVGKAYNDAMLAIDAMGPGYGTLGLLLQQFNYSNIYRWKHLDSFTKVQSNKAGVWTNYRTRRTMITWGIRWLRRRIWLVRSPHFLAEAPFFAKDDDDAKAEAIEGHHDDAIMSALYANYAAHEDDKDPMTGRFNLPEGIARAKDGGQYVAVCVNGHKFETDDPSQNGRGRCPNCGSIIKEASRREVSQSSLAERLVAMAQSRTEAKNFDIPPFDQL